MEIFIPFIGIEAPMEVMQDIAIELGIVTHIKYIGRPAKRAAHHMAVNKPHQHYRVTLSPESERYRAWSAPRVSKARRLNAVCWHGHRDWMLQLFETYGWTTLTSSSAKYYGYSHFIDTYEDSYNNGFSANQICNCTE